MGVLVNVAEPDNDATPRKRPLLLFPKKNTEPSALVWSHSAHFFLRVSS